jgi:predicted CoA-binding protein
MRHLTRAKARAELLLERARTMAIVGPTLSERAQETVGYLRKVGYDLVPVGDGPLADTPGSVDLVLVFGRPVDVPRLLEQAATKRVDGIWYIEHAPSHATSSLARRLGLALVVGDDIVRRHRERQREAGQPSKLSAGARRRGRKQPIDADPSVAKGWAEAGGGGSQGGGGGRSAINERFPQHAGEHDQSGDLSILGRSGSAGIAACSTIPIVAPGPWIVCARAIASSTLGATSKPR